MHRTWRVDIKDFVREGDNELRIIFRAPITYMEEHVPEEGKEIHYIPAGGMAGNQYIRKAHCMFGWDWGAQIPDAGIWRDIELEIYSQASFGDTRLIQKHYPSKDDGSAEACDAPLASDTDVEITVETEISVDEPGCYKVEAFLYEPRVRAERAGAVQLCALTDPDPLDILEHSVTQIFVTAPGKQKVQLQLVAAHARLWWPNHLGEQPLYTVELRLSRLQSQQDSKKEECLLEQKSWRLGLRTFTVSTEKDQWGNEFAFTVNGVKFFAMGADYIPEDTIYSHITRERIEYLIRACVRSNFNTLRVWGGGYYPSDTFYDLCDEYGLMVWQDLMYACNVYELTDAFEKNIASETADNVIRLRHHASLALWCGNNEIESAWAHWYGFCDHSAALRKDYLTMFEILLPGIVKEHDPEHFWWPSSPSSGGWFDNPDDDNRGDRHYWDVWHGQKPFTDYQNYYFRFCSEFGFQSFPAVKTIDTFTLPEDRNIFSEVMESHQKNGYANGKILYYLSENFLYPKDFESLVYVTQLLQGLAIKFGVEHWRRNRGRCMGALYWQLNDSWPVASWSSIDYFGRWKALQYMAADFFEPLAISVKEEHGQIEVWLENETAQRADVAVTCRLRSVDFTILDEEQFLGACEDFGAAKLFEKDYSALIAGRASKVYLEVVAAFADGQTRTEVVTFVPWKHLQLPVPKISAALAEEEQGFVLKLTSDVFAPFVELNLKKADCIFSDNYFHITGTQPITVRLEKKDLTGMKQPTLVKLKKELTVRSLRDSY
jgi:beta-mannosidase